MDHQIKNLEGILQFGLGANVTLASTIIYRAVGQYGSPPALGAGCQKFKSSQPDKNCVIVLRCIKPIKGEIMVGLLGLNGGWPNSSDSLYHNM